jgi:hypothetical protein
MKYKTTRSHKKVTATIMGERWTTGDGKMRLVEKVSERGIFARKPYTRVFVTDGKKFWMTAPERKGKELGLLELIQVAQATHAARVTGLLYLVREPERYRVNFLRTEKVGEYDAVTLKVETDGMPDVLLSFDRKTWLLVKHVTHMQLLFFPPFPMESVFSDFKTIEGCRVAMKRVYVDERGTDEEEIIEYRHVKELDEKLFREPLGGRGRSPGLWSWAELGMGRPRRRPPATAASRP